MQALMELKNVCYKVGNTQILRGISLELRPGEILALAGPNGAGKSTLLGVMAGDLTPTSGAVSLFGRPVSSYKLRALARQRAVMLQEARVSFPFTVAEIVSMARVAVPGSPAQDDAAVAAALLATDALQLADRRFPSLSGGEKARVSFARTMAQETALLLLDEPTAALDIRHQEMLMGLARGLADSGRAVATVLHDLSLAAAWADRLALIGDGQLVDIGPVAEVATGPALSCLYQHPVAVECDPVTRRPVVLPRRGLAAQPKRLIDQVM
jgi:iron complex transport system ATP-binding protein